MYKQVETTEELELFNQIYQAGFREKNYEIDYGNSGDFINLLVENKFGDFGGTIQFAPYNPEIDNSLLDFPKLFLEFEMIRNSDLSRVLEIDKVTVLESDRKNGTLDNIIETIYQYTKNHNILYLVGEMNPVFYRALKIVYGITGIKASKLTRSRNSRYSVQPVILDLNSVWKEYEAKMETAKGICS